MFQGIQAVALPLATEFGFTKEIEDRALAQCFQTLVADQQSGFRWPSGSFLAAGVVFPIASVVHMTL